MGGGSRLRQGMPHGCGALAVVVVVLLKDVGEKEQPEYGEENHQLYDDDGPQPASHGH